MDLNTGEVAMRKFSLSNYYYQLLAAATVWAWSAESASAQNTIGTVAQTVLKQVSDMGKLVVGGAFLGGVGFVGSGLMKLKQAADTQGQQVKYSEGIWRLGVGAGLVAVPAVTNMLTASGSLGTANVNAYTGF